MSISFATRRRIVLAVLAATTLWPITHHVIVRAFDQLSPWKGFAWSMYCVPHRAVDVRCFAVDERREIHPNMAVPRLRRAVVLAMTDFAKRRTIFSYRVVPDEFGAVLLDAFPSERAIRIEVVEHVVERKTARMMRGREDKYIYERVAR